MSPQRHTRFKDHFGSTTPTPVNEAGDAPDGGVNRDQAAAEAEAAQAMKQYDRQDKVEQKRQP